MSGKFCKKLKRDFYNKWIVKFEELQEKLKLALLKDILIDGFGGALEVSYPKNKEGFYVCKIEDIDDNIYVTLKRDNLRTPFTLPLSSVSILHFKRIYPDVIPWSEEFWKEVMDIDDDNIKSILEEGHHCSESFLLKSLLM